MTQGLTTGDDLAEVLEVHRSTLFRNQKRYREGGLDALRDGRGHGAPRRAHKLTDEVLPVAQACLDQGGSQSAAARAVGVSETAIRHALKAGRLRRRPQPCQRRAALSPAARAERDAAQAQGAGTAVKRLHERLLATRAEKTLKAKKAQLGRAHVRHAQGQRDGATKAKQAKEAQLIERLERECAELGERIKAMDKRVPLKSVLDPEQIVQHETERKTITQLIKVVAYRSESCLASLIEPFFARHDDEVRAFLKTVFRLPGDILPDHERGQLRVRLYGLANNRSQQALVALCECLNAQRTVYPGTDLRLVFEAIQSH